MELHSGSRFINICYDLFLWNRWWPLGSLGYWTCLHSCPKSKEVASSNTNLESICWTHLSCWHIKVQKTKWGFETDPLVLDLVTPTASLNWKKHFIIDVKPSFYECSFLPALIFREANALAKFVASLRSLVCCNKNSLPDSIQDVWRKDVVFVWSAL